MHYEVHNWNLGVGHVSIIGVSGSSLFLVGDSHEINLAALFDTPPESYIVGIDTLKNPGEDINGIQND
ncbi:spore gernimation protein GerPD [Gracilibacillus kekensis]|uniref:Spore germination protein PD n=1 Tax=Gracilibacillus kekensis TaxID=1027249 RepID=A0A1M7IT29_9BACI|nr:spore gernimation protein GerPD [Gracilibacillus kekensis]SHM43758.1 spore germination protein PD [Gracilibacillus kekensis]